MKKGKKEHRGDSGLGRGRRERHREREIGREMRERESQICKRAFQLRWDRGNGCQRGERQTERERERDLYIYIYTYTRIHIFLLCVWTKYRWIGWVDRQRDRDKMR